MEIRILHRQGKSIKAIARELGVSRTTVRKYLRSHRAPGYGPRAPRASKLDAYKCYIESRIKAAHPQWIPSSVLLREIRELGYGGGWTILRDYVARLKPQKKPDPVVRFETAPGEQMQIDWGTFIYDVDGVRKKVYGMTAIMSHSRSRFALYSKRCDTASLIRAIMDALEYFGGLPETILSDRMKSVLVRVEDGALIWNSVYADFLAAIGVAPRVCRPRTPQTKGKVERSIRVIKESFWPGVRFTDIADLNEQVFAWCEARNSRVHRTTHERPVRRLQKENLHPLPEGYAWERFRSERRRVSWDGFISFDGVLYGLPSDPLTAGDVVDVTCRDKEIQVWYRGQFVVRHAVRQESGTTVWHPEQFKNVLPVNESRRSLSPVGYQIPALEAPHRMLSDYDQIFGASEVKG
ncbi:MAG: IS21 family transposase [Bacteroidetes bacterium]|nr:IS21 family transposase [Bacteroidota bacterium]